MALSPEQLLFAARLGLNPLQRRPPSLPGDPGPGFGWGSPGDPTGGRGPERGGRGGDYDPGGRTPVYVPPPYTESRATRLFKQMNVAPELANYLIRMARRGKMEFAPDLMSFTYPPRERLYRDDFGTQLGEGRDPELVRRLVGQLREIQDVHATRRGRFRR